MNTRGVFAKFGGAQTDSMHLDVIGMAVSAVLVVGAEGVRSLLLEESRQALRRLVHVGLPETSGIVVGGFARHARIAVSEVLVAADTQRVTRRGQLHGASLCQGFAGGEEAVGHLAQLAACGGYEDDAVSLGRHPGHRPPGLDRLVVGMRMEEHDC